MTILIEINNGQPIPLLWYLFILLFFRVLALENIAKILTTEPMLFITNPEEENKFTCQEVRRPYFGKLTNSGDPD